MSRTLRFLGLLASLLGVLLGVAAPASAQDAEAATFDGGPPPLLDAGPPPAEAPPPRDASLDASSRDAATPDAAVALDAFVPLPDAGPPDTGAPLPDAGPPDAGAPPPPPEASADVPWATLLNELLFERAERAERRRGVAPAPRAAPRDGVPLAPTTVVNTPRDVDVNIVGCAAQPELFGLGFPERRISTFGLFLLIAFALLAVVGLDRARRPLPARGLVPRVLGTAHLVARLAAVVMIIMLTSRFLPVWLRPALLLTIAAVAVTIGFGAVWVVLPDVIGGIILITERRLRPGLFISGEGFRGTLEQIGPRLTTLRAQDGTTLTIPNRDLVKSRVQSSSRRWHEVEVELSAPPGVDAPRIRRAIEDAVLSSPHIPPAPALTVSRDPAQPDRWRVSARLIDARFSPDFEGQLLERVEEALATDLPSEPAPSEAPS